HVHEAHLNPARSGLPDPHPGKERSGRAEREEISMHTRLHRAASLGAVAALLLTAVACSDDEDDPDAADGGATATTEAPSDSGIELVDDSLTAEIAIGDLDQPSSLAFLPDGMLV